MAILRGCRMSSRQLGSGVRLEGGVLLWNMKDKEGGVLGGFSRRKKHWM
jgi:hypothetical protein